MPWRPAAAGNDSPLEASTHTHSSSTSIQSRDLSDLTRGDPKRTQRWLNRSLQVWARTALEEEEKKGRKSHRSQLSRNKFQPWSFWSVVGAACRRQYGILTRSQGFSQTFFGSEQWREGGVETYHKNSLAVCWGEITNWMEREGGKKGHPTDGREKRKKGEGLISFFPLILCPQSGSESSPADGRLINTR